MNYCNPKPKIQFRFQSKGIHIINTFIINKNVKCLKLKISNQNLNQNKHRMSLFFNNLFTR